MSNCRITDEGLRFFSRLINLHTLILKGNPIEGKHLNALNPLKKIKHLDMSDTYIEKTAFNGVLNEGQLSNVNISMCLSIDQLAVSTIHAFENIQKLDLSGNFRLRDDSLHNLRKLKNLVELNMQCTSISDKSLKEFSFLDNLEILNLSSTDY